MEGNFEHLSHEPWPLTCGRIVLKLYKKLTKSENHKICHDIMISYVEAKVKKKLRRFHTNYDVRFLQIEASPGKIHRVDK